MADLEFRPCKPSDVNSAAPLILESGHEAFSYVFKNRDVDALDYLKFAFQRKGGEFSYNNHYVLKFNNDIVGVGTAFDKKKADGFMIKEIINILKFYKLRAFGVMIRGLKIEQKLMMPKKNEVYLAHLTIHQNFRSRGYGKVLIDFLIQIFEKNSKVKFVLDVSDENPRAKQLYEKLGFTQTKFITSSLRTKYGYVPNFFRMELKNEKS